MTGLLIFMIFTQCMFLLGAYAILAPWRTTKAGTAYFGLIASLAILSGHFLIEEMVGQAPQWVEDIALALVSAAIIWNAAIVVWKQIHFWRSEGAPQLHEPFSKEP